MTDQPREPREGFIVVRKYGTGPIPVSTEIYPVTLDPHPPPPDPDFERRKVLAGIVIPASIRALDQLTDPLSRAVLDLHRRTAWETDRRWECGECLDGEDRSDWPCTTVEAVAAVHGIDLTDDWLYERPTDGSLDLPDPEDS